MKVEDFHFVFLQVFELDILLSGYFSHIGPTVHDNVSIKPSPIFLNVMLGQFKALFMISNVVAISMYCRLYSKIDDYLDSKECLK